MDRPIRKCNNVTCTEFGSWVGGYCPQHRKARESSRKSPQALSFYQSKEWDRFREYLKGLGNVICQRVDPFGIRCRNAVYIFHHILEFDTRRELGLHWENVVGVCAGCHPRPTDKDQGQYVPTLWRAPFSADPLPVQVVGPGDRVPRELVLWCVANRKERFS